MIIPSDTHTQPAPATAGKLSLFSLYVDFPSSVDARWLASTMKRLAGSHWQTSSEMWKVDSLAASEPIRQMITNDAANADVIIVAVSSLTHREPALVQWLESLAAETGGRPGAGLIIGLLGDEETKAADMEWTVKSLLRCAHQAGRDFIWRWMGEGAMNDDSWLTDDFKNLLARKLATDHEVVF
jgi:hypothetical protein